MQLEGFIRTRIDMLAMFMDSKCLKTIAGCSRKWDQVGYEVVTCRQASRIGVKLLDVCSSVVDLVLCAAKIDTLIAEFEAGEWNDATTKTFTDLMRFPIGGCLV